jgi:hypothetical protein
MGLVRWEYLFGTHGAEAQRRDELERKIAAFWSAFDERRAALNDTFSGRGDLDIPAFMGATLQEIDPELMWEYGPALRGSGHRLVITPEGRKDLRPLVRAILSRAPEFDGWEFYAHRRAESLEMARHTVEARCRRPSSLAEVVVSRGEHHLIDLKFSGPKVDDEDAASHEAYVLSETLLGEEVLDAWIGEIGVHSRPRGLLSRIGLRSVPEGAVPLANLKDAVDAEMGRLRRELTSVSTTSQSSSWSLLELEPKKRADYPWQFDLFVAKTPNLDLWRATRAPRFYDERFSGTGETFCYLKLDGSQGLDEEKFADKAAIEDALDELLLPAGLGCQIGGGTGLRYSYIELALNDFERALPAIRKLLIEGNVPKRSWILFHHCERRTEWIGIYDDSPPPPEGDLSAD